MPLNRSAESIIRKHYGLTRRVTEAEVEAEIANLIRKHTRGSLDDMSEPLWAALVVAGPYPGAAIVIQVRITFTNPNPNTIWNRLAARLGREPTNAEATAEVKRILSDGLVDLASQGKLPHQRKRS